MHLAALLTLTVLASREANAALQCSKNGSPLPPAVSAAINAKFPIKGPSTPGAGPAPPGPARGKPGRLGKRAPPGPSASKPSPPVIVSGTSYYEGTPDLYAAASAQGRPSRPLAVGWTGIQTPSYENIDVETPLSPNPPGITSSRYYDFPSQLESEDRSSQFIQAPSSRFPSQRLDLDGRSGRSVQAPSNRPSGRFPMTDTLPVTMGVSTGVQTSPSTGQSIRRSMCSGLVWCYEGIRDMITMKDLRQSFSKIKEVGGPKYAIFVTSTFLTMAGVSVAGYAVYTAHKANEISRAGVDAANVLNGIYSCSVFSAQESSLCKQVEKVGMEIMAEVIGKYPPGAVVIHHNRRAAPPAPSPPSPLVASGAGAAAGGAGSVSCVPSSSTKDIETYVREVLSGMQRSGAFDGVSGPLVISVAPPNLQGANKGGSSSSSPQQVPLRIVVQMVTEEELRTALGSSWSTVFQNLAAQIKQQGGNLQSSSSPSSSSSTTASRPGPVGAGAAAARGAKIPA